MDADEDGLDQCTEEAIGTSDSAWDTDGDGLGDREEHEATRHYATDPRRFDTDGDGLGDGDEMDEHSTDPLRADTDGDGLNDAEEFAHGTDPWRPDSDSDFLPDGLEVSNGFNPLDPDTRDSDTFDYLVWTYGNHSMEDLDRDGIPDAWESSDGPLEWGALSPTPGERDLLLEFVYAQPPPPSIGDGLDLTPLYEEAAAWLEERLAVSVSWISAEAFAPDAFAPWPANYELDPWFSSFLPQATSHADNPYVVTVVLVPHMSRAPERNYVGWASDNFGLVVADLGFALSISIDAGDGQILKVPVPIEDTIHSGYGYHYNMAPYGRAGSMFYAHRGGYNITWEPGWFRGRTVNLDDGETNRTGNITDVELTRLNWTIAHELGHIFGLCHPNEGDCATTLSEEDRPRAHESIMATYTDNPGRRNYFLPSELQNLYARLDCPPVMPLYELARMDEAGLEPSKWFRGIISDTGYPANGGGRECWAPPESGGAGGGGGQ